jgi:hypothetical protein
MHRPGYCGNAPVLQVQVPSVYEQIPDMVVSDIMSEGGMSTSAQDSRIRDILATIPAMFHELVSQTPHAPSTLEVLL